MNARDTDVSTNPFPGLRPFREQEEHLFFGREKQVDAMVDKLAETHFLAVVGTSGSGKSSLVNCGLRPALHRGWMPKAGTAWRIAQFRPGSNPIRGMAAALASDGALYTEFKSEDISLAETIESGLRTSKLGLIMAFGQARLDANVNLLVVVDQFEELFRYDKMRTSGSEVTYGLGEEAKAFVNLLLEVRAHTSLPIYVVLTMRSDFLGDCAQFFGLPEAINKGQYLVPRMSRDERRLAIVGPVAVGGAQIDPALATRLVNDVGDNPDQLSILQHALNRTWARWENQGERQGPLALAHYEAIGTMAHALDQHAERAFAELDPERKQKICEKIMKALTDWGTDARGTRRPTKLRTLCALAQATEAEATEVIDVFRRPSRSFLMPPAGEKLDAETVIDISHESLMRVWERLKVWGQEEARSAQMYRRLAETAELHNAGKSNLWRDLELENALDWQAKNQPNETWAAQYSPEFDRAMRFLQDSKTARDQQVAAERRRANRRRWITAASMLAFFLAAIVFYFLWHEAEKAKNVAQQATRTSLSRELAARANKAFQKQQRDLALLLGVAAQDVYVTNEAEEALGTALEKAPARFLWGHQKRVTGVAFSPDSKTLASASEDGTVILWDIGTGKPRVDPLKAPEGDVSKEPEGNGVTGIAFSPDGKTLASASQTGTVFLWDVGTGKRKAEPLKGHQASVTTIAFSPDGKTLASASEDGTVILWDVATGKYKVELPTWRRDWVTAIAFSPNDGKTLASATQAGTVILWDTGTGRRLRTLEGHVLGVTSVAFSPDGKTLASASDDTTVVLWDAATGRRKSKLAEHVDLVSSIAFSPDGKTLASASQDKTVVLWDVATGKRLVKPLTKHQDGVTSIAFSPDGKTLASASDDGTVILWNTDDGFVNDELKAHQVGVKSVAFSPDGKKLVTASDDGALILWNVPLEAGAQDERVAGPEWANSKRHACEIANRKLKPKEFEGAANYELTC